jgi:hypothetical protein
MRIPLRRLLLTLLAATLGIFAVVLPIALTAPAANANGSNWDNGASPSSSPN